MSQTVEMNLSHLTELLRMSKSLVFVPDRATAKIVRKACHALGLPYLMVEPEMATSMRHFESDKENFATIVSPSSERWHGWKSLATQAIWIGPIPAASEPCFTSYVDFLANATVDNHHQLENWGTP